MLEPNSICLITNLKKFNGKRIKIKTKTGSEYSGVLHVSSDKSIILSNLTIHHKSGGKTTSKHNEKRKFKTENIFEIELEE